MGLRRVRYRSEGDGDCKGEKRSLLAFQRVLNVHLLEEEVHRQ